MEWIKVNDYNDLPKNEKPFLVMWKGRVCLAQYDIEDLSFYLAFDPAIYDGTVKVDLNHAGKFKYWMELPKEKFDIDATT
jgi:hypothetical protein